MPDDREREEREGEREWTTALKLPIRMQGYIYYTKLAIAENAVQLKRGILLGIALNMRRLGTGYEQWQPLA